MNSNSLNALKNGLLKGIGFAIGLCATGLMAASIPLWTETIAPYTPFASNEVITADAFNKKFDALRGAIGDIDPQFSTTETATHQRWTDGKVIYRRVVSFGALPNSTQKDVAHGIASLATVTRLYGMMSNGTVQYQLPHSDPTGSNRQTPLFADNTNVSIATGSAFWTAYSATIIIEYTKN